MRARRTPSRLETHRLKYNRNGRRGSLLRVDQLTKYEKDLLYKDVLQDVRVKRIDFTGDMDEAVFDQVEMEVFAEWGVMCPHPESSREYNKKWRQQTCGVCGCLIATWTWPVELRLKLER